MRQLVAVCAVITAFGCGGKKAKGKEYTVPQLVEALKDADANMRYWAARELGKVKGGDVAIALPALTSALADSDENVRMGAAYALGDIGPEAQSALPALQKATKDPSKGVRDGAAYAVKKVQGKK